MQSEKFANIILIAATNGSGGEIEWRSKNRIAGTAHTTNLVEHGIVERQTLLNVMQPAQPGSAFSDGSPGRSIRQRAQSAKDMQSAAVVRRQQTRGSWKTGSGSRV
jgi:hypothetical protein